jgi:hypothetical protein
MLAYSKQSKNNFSPMALWILPVTILAKFRLPGKRANDRRADALKF